QDAQLLFVGEMSSDEKAYLLKALQGIPQEERATLIRDAKPLFVGEMSGDEKVELLKALQCIPQSKRSRFIEEVKPVLATWQQLSTDENFLLIFYLLPDQLKT